MSNYLKYLFIISFMFSSPAIAEDDVKSDDVWFGLIDYSLNLKTESDPSDINTDSSTYLNGLTDEFENSYGIGMGYRFSNNVAISARYELADIEPSSTLDLRDNDDGEVFTVGQTGGGGEIINIMLEGTYYIPYSDNLEFFALGGIGRAQIKSDQLSTVFDGEIEQGTCKLYQNENTSYRLGLGTSYYMTQKNGFYAALTYTNYGDYKVRDFDDGFCGSEATAMDKDLESQDLRIGYFFSF
jgi:opacity protein-like surface antigen